MSSYSVIKLASLKKLCKNLEFSHRFDEIVLDATKIKAEAMLLANLHIAAGANPPRLNSTFFGHLI